MSFPEVKFGTCQICGSSGGDQATPSSADAIARDTAGNGVPLEEFEGKKACQLCIKRLRADTESRASADKHAESDRFRRRAGFTNSV